MASNESSTIQQPKGTNGLKNNYENEKMIEKFGSKANFQRARCQFQLDIDIRKIREKPIFQEYEKSIYEVEWINEDMVPIILVKIDGTKAKQEASFYVQLSSHPHIVRTYGLVQSSPDSILLVQERSPLGNLSELLRENELKPSERVLWNIFEQICDAMIFLAQKSIIHGNLACRNVLVFQMNPNNPKNNLVKLTDFGFTRGSKLYSFIDSQTTTTMKIIPVRSAAPELLKNPKKPEYSEKSDVYSMGVLMWEACSYGEQPYSNIDDQETVRQEKLKDKMLPQPSLCSDHLWTIINECWNQKQKKRPNFQSLKQSISNLQSKSISK
jgi:serine/threonine protein kinase